MNSNIPVVVIGDVHGRSKALKTLADHIPHNAHVVLVGDLIDRGPDSVEVCHFVKHHGWDVVLGNHEWMMIKAFEDPLMMDLWLSNGGIETLNSIEQTASKLNISPNSLIAELTGWFKAFPLYVEIRLSNTTLLITHAGVKLGLSTWQEALNIPLDDPDSIIWYRGPLGNFEGITQVCGHTPVPNGPIQEGYNWRIDTGCTYRHQGLGYLSALIFYPERFEPEVIRVSCRQ